MSEASPFCVGVIRTFEKLSLVPYLDQGGKRTIGYGHLVHDTEVFDRITEDEAERLLTMDVREARGAVDRLVGEAAPQHLDAVTSFVFNLGALSLQRSTLLMKLRTGDKVGAAREFRRWCYVGGKVSDGLLRRRIAEELWFLGGAPESVMDLARRAWR